MTSSAELETAIRDLTEHVERELPLLSEQLGICLKLFNELRVRVELLEKARVRGKRR